MIPIRRDAFRAGLLSLPLAVTSCVSAPKRVPLAEPMASFASNLKFTIVQQTIAMLRKEGGHRRGYVMTQFHYLDGKLLDANVIYQVGNKELGDEVVGVLMQAKVPAPIPAIAGKRTRFLVDFCFMLSNDVCLQYERRAFEAEPPDTADKAQP